MRNLRTLDRAYFPILALLGVLILMNLWMITTTLLKMPISPFSAVVTNVLSGLYIVGVPIAGIAVVILTACRGVLRRISWMTALIQLGAVVAMLLFWGWSLDHSYLP